MKEAPPVLSEEIKACLATLYSPDKISHLLHQFAQQATLHANDLNVVGSISSFFNTLMLRWPAKKEQVLNTILYKSKEYRLIPLLYQAWSSTNEARLFNGDAINSQLIPAVASFSQSPNSWSILYLLNELYTRFLLTLADMEFLDKTANNMNHLPLSQVIDLSRQLKVCKDK
jgi:ubiquitin-protein ligase E3 C